MILCLSGGVLSFHTFDGSFSMNAGRQLQTNCDCIHFHLIQRDEGNKTLQAGAVFRAPSLSGFLSSGLSVPAPLKKLILFLEAFTSPGRHLAPCQELLTIIASPETD